MSPEGSPSLASTMAALDRFADELLHEKGFYKITSYGWADHDTIDPEFSGHALWQTEPPFEPDWERIFDGGVPRWTPSSRAEQLMLNGEDFTGAMLIARQFAGLALCVDRNTDPASIDDEQFWCQVATCSLWLGIASDRIREYFLITMFGQNTDQYMRMHRGDTWASPFTTALALARDAEELSLFHRLEPLGQLLQSARKGRHAIIHQVVTREAARGRETLREQRTHAVSKQPYPVRQEITFEELSACKPSKIPQEQRNAAIEEAHKWYEVLAAASHIIFLLERERRHLPKEIAE